MKNQVLHAMGSLVQVETQTKGVPWHWNIVKLCNQYLPTFVNVDCAIVIGLAETGTKIEQEQLIDNSRQNVKQSQ